MFNWQKLLPLNIQRKHLLKRFSASPLKHYLSNPVPALSQQVSDAEFLVLDFETSGLNAKKDHVLSVGYTLIKNNRVTMKNNQYAVIRQQTELEADNVTIHQLTDSAIESGEEMRIVFDRLINDMAGRVVVAHNAAIEKNFINAACKKLYGSEIPIRLIDTLQIEKKRRQRRHQIIKQNQLRLFNLRKEYGLPRYKAHNALEDAIATGELFLQQIAYVCGTRRCQLKDLY